MKPLLHLFRKAPAPPPPPPPPPTLPQRIAALQAAPGEVVVTTALGGDEEGLRVAAIRLLRDGDALRALAGLAETPEGVALRTPQAVRLAAQERLAQLVDDPGVLARLACESPSSRVRQAAATAIEDPAQLRDLLQRVRGKDKAAYRIVKQKCDAIAAEKKKAEDFAREADALCAALERLSKRVPDPLYAASLEVLTAQWRALPMRAGPGCRTAWPCGHRALPDSHRGAREPSLARQASEAAARQRSSCRTCARARSRATGGRGAGRGRCTWRWRKPPRLVKPKNRRVPSGARRKTRPTARSAA